MPSRPPLEVAVFSAKTALQAQRNGASRIELNAPGSYSHGGLTPPVAELARLTKDLEIPMRVMIRPVGIQLGSGPDFVYSNDEFQAMKHTILEIKEAGVLAPKKGDGFVFGILKQDNDGLRVDSDRCRELIDIAMPHPCVFHRAFDSLAEGITHEDALNELVNCGFQGLLTSGGIGSHDQHLGRLKKLIDYADGRIQIIVGGGVRAGNVGAAIEKLGRHGGDAVWFHTACLATGDDIVPESLDDREMKNILINMEGSL